MPHTINLDPEEQWSIEPAVDLNFGSRHYYGSYISERQRKKGKGSSSGGSGGTGGGGTGGGGTGGGGTGGGGTGSGNPVIDIEKTVVALGTDQLALLDYEVSVPLYYRGKNGDSSLFLLMPFLVVLLLTKQLSKQPLRLMETLFLIPEFHRL